MSTSNDHVDAPIEYRAPTQVSDMDLSERSAKTKLLKRTPSQHGGALKVVIVGGVAGGASAAARMRRLNEKAEIILLQSGPDVSFASCGMPYYLGGEITDRPGMAVQTPQSLKEKLNLDVRVNTHVSAIDTTAKTVTCNGLDQAEYKLEYDELVLAVGAEPFKPPIPGIDRPGLFSLRNLQDMDDIYDWMNQQKSKRDNAGDLHYVVAGAGVSRSQPT
jgi:NADH dehydrogenase FAD-containing subunit